MARSWGMLVLVWVLAVAAVARADGDPDTEAAKRHFAAGLELYGLERYAEAIREFEQARTLKPLPAFDFNIGRCQERLERWGDAVAAYERYLAAVPPFGAEAMEVRERLGVLKRRIAHPEERRVSPSRALRVTGAVALGVGAAALVAGTGAYLSAYPDYVALRAQCGPRCMPGQVTPLWDRVQRAESAGIALWSAGAALALVGVPLLVLGREQRERAPARVSAAPLLGPGMAGLSVAGVLP